MTTPWETASEVMWKYYESKGLRWPAREATRLLKRVKNPLRANGCWTSTVLESCAQAALSTSYFDVDDLAENHLGIRVDYDSLAYLDSSIGAPVYGCAYPLSREIIICERVLEYPPLHRATVMHEVGHVLLHSAEAMRCLMYVPELRSTNPVEQEANQFKQVTLIHSSILKLAIVQISQEWLIDPRISVLSANTERGKWIWRYRLMPSLVNRLCISRQMLSIKLKKLGIFTSETLRFHTSYAMATRWGVRTPQLQLRNVVSKSRRDVGL